MVCLGFKTVNCCYCMSNKCDHCQDSQNLKGYRMKNIKRKHCLEIYFGNVHEKQRYNNHFYFSRPWCQAQTQSRWHSVKWEQQFSTNNLRSREAQNWSKETRNNFATEPFTKGFPVFESFCSGVFVRSKYFVTIYIKLWQLILSDLSLIICIYKNCSEIQNPSFASFEL